MRQRIIGGAIAFLLGLAAACALWFSMRHGSPADPDAACRQRLERLGDALDRWLAAHPGNRPPIENPLAGRRWSADDPHSPQAVLKDWLDGGDATTCAACGQDFIYDPGHPIDDYPIAGGRPAFRCPLAADGGGTHRQGESRGVYACFVSGGLKAAAAGNEALHRQLRELEEKAARSGDAGVRQQVDTLRQRLFQLDRGLVAAGKAPGPSVDVQFVPVAPPTGPHVPESKRTR